LLMPSDPNSFAALHLKVMLGVKQLFFVVIVIVFVDIHLYVEAAEAWMPKTENIDARIVKTSVRDKTLDTFAVIITS